MPMFRGGYRRYFVFMRRCARDGMINSLLLICASLWGMAIGDAVINVITMITKADAPWNMLAYIIGVFAAMWITISITITLLLAWHRYREDQDKFIKAMTEKQ